LDQGCVLNIRKIAFNGIELVSAKFALRDIENMTTQIDQNALQLCINDFIDEDEYRILVLTLCHQYINLGYKITNIKDLIVLFG